MMNKKLFLFISILCIISLTLTKIFITNKFFLLKEYFNLDNSLFVDKETSYNNVINSKYFNDLNKINLKVRGCDNLEDCKKIYLENLTDFTEEEKEKLTNLIEHANDITEKFNRFHSVPWRLAKTSSKIENGFPHTIGRIIYISDEFLNKSRKYKLQTIIHEKLHLFQRIYPQETQRLYEDLEFIKIKKINDPLRRHNPDLDDYDYEYRGVRVYNKFKNENPDSLSDGNTVYLPYTKNIVNKMITKNYNNEHPNEIFAHLISKQIVKKNLNNKFVNYLS